MHRNVGIADWLARAILGIVAPLSPWGWLGVAPLATVALSWYPLYTLLGIRTCAPTTAPPRN